MSKNFLNGIETTSLDVSGPSITSNGSNILGIVDNGGSRYVGVNNTPLVAPGTEGPTIFPLGTTNLDLNIQSAGTGNVNINGYEAATSENTLAFTNKNLTDPSNTFPTLNQNTTGNAGTATKLQTARTINGVSFDGTTNITIPTGLTRSINSVSTATTAGATANTDYVYLVSGPTTLTLPTAVSNTNLYTVKNNGSNTVTIATTSSQTIDGSATVTLTPYTSLDLISNNSNWSII